MVCVHTSCPSVFHQSIIVVDVYELVTRHFLACCGRDAIGDETVVRIRVGQESFSATGLMIMEQNFLEVYTYMKWSDKSLPVFQEGETIMPTEMLMRSGHTTAPQPLTEYELITLMDKHGIGFLRLATMPCLSLTWCFQEPMPQLHSTLRLSKIENMR